MATVDDIGSLVEGLSIAETTNSVGPVSPKRPSIEEALYPLIESAKLAASQAREFQSSNALAELRVSEICSVSRAISELTQVARLLESTANNIRQAEEDSIMDYLGSLADQKRSFFGGYSIQALFSHFETQIRSIVRRLLDKSTDGKYIVWKAAEECYEEANGPSGELCSDDYFLGLEESSLEWPYDPDYQSEEYYEHENRLQVDESYANAFLERIRQKNENRRREMQTWIDFWVEVLNKCPGGPTLFHPAGSYRSDQFEFIITDIPQYLFRTFDNKSSGTNNESVVASVANGNNPAKPSRTDILSLEEEAATKMLHSHLDNSRFRAEESDDLMSWTSSLLFAIQYAIWRCHIFRCHPADIKICAVDTEKFPTGQFAQDQWLLRSYRDTADRMSDRAKEFFRFRLEDERFQNGEYLSQGSVTHAGRSAVVSLETLEMSGLYDLYPEFKDDRGKTKWAKRALELRSHWSIEHITTAQEIELALTIARECFNSLEVRDIALMLLAFKNRKYKPTVTSTPEYNSTKNYIPDWAQKPDEVRRYVIAERILQSRRRNKGEQNHEFFRLINHSTDYNSLEEIFECALSSS